VKPPKVGLMVGKLDIFRTLNRDQERIASLMRQLVRLWHEACHLHKRLQTKLSTNVNNGSIVGSEAFIGSSLDATMLTPRDKPVWEHIQTSAHPCMTHTAAIQLQSAPLRATSTTNGQTPWPLVRKRTIPTERPTLVSEIYCQLLWIEGCRVVSAADPLRSLISVF
jgi:hypothetical protein